MKRSVILAAVVAVAVSGATRVSADTITFDPTGTPGDAGNVTIDLLDAAPGNSLTIGVTKASTPGTNADILFQANLSVAKLGDLVQFSNGFGDDFFKFVAGLPAIVTSNSGITSPGNPFPTLTFGFDATGGTNFFNIYHDDVPGRDLPGDRYTDGDLVLSGTFLSSRFFANFTADLTQPIDDLDQFGGDNYSATDTITGGGTFRGNIQLTFAHADFFPGLSTGTTLFVASSKEALPYTQANPSACFSATGTPGPCFPGVSSVGAINGVSGPNTILETDASFSFDVEDVRQVPEPASSLALFGFGLLACAGMRRRQMRKSN